MFVGDEDSIRAVHDLWVGAELRGETDTLSELLADDVVMAPPEGPATQGRDLVMSILGQAASPPQELATSIALIRVAGRNALKLADFRGVSADGAMYCGSHVWRLRFDHKWRIALLTWTIAS